MQSVDTSHFSIDGKALKMPKIQQTALVTFYSKKGIAQDPRIMKMLQQLAQTRTDIKWLVCDIDSNPSLLNLSKTTTSPIQSVPYFFLFVNGFPKAMKKPTLAPQELLNFINDVLQKLSTQGGSGRQTMMPSQTMNTAQAKWKPESWTEERAAKMPARLESENRLEIPTDIIPKNEPWEATIKQITE